jgi:hypothetical protein
MANGFRFERNSAELRKILQKQAMPAVRQVADQILAKVGTQHYESEEWIGVNRGRVTVRTKPDGISMGHEAKHHALIAALGGVGSESAPDPNERIAYTNRRGVTSMRTRAEIANYTRNRSG